MIHWKVTSLQFEALIFANNRDRVPYPIRHDSVTDSTEELYRQRCAAIESLLPRVDDDLATAVATLVDSEVRVLSHAHTGHELGVELRAFAGVGPRWAALAVQQPDPMPGVCGDVRVTLCRPHEFARLIVETMPDTPAGRFDEINVPRSELEVEPQEYYGLNRPWTMQERFERFYQREQVAWGEVTVYPGAFIDNRVTDGLMGFFWADFDRDGRYFLINDDTITARPMSREQFVGAIDKFTLRGRDRARQGYVSGGARLRV